jgi:hypothetical protein
MSICFANDNSWSKLHQENNTHSLFTMIESLYFALKDEDDGTLFLMHRPDLVLSELE